MAQPAGSQTIFAKADAFLQRHGVSAPAGIGFVLLVSLGVALLFLSSQNPVQQVRAVVLSSGSVVQGATVQVLSPEGAVIASGVTGADGSVSFSKPLPSSGRVILKVSKQGFVSASGEREALAVIDLARNKPASIELYSSQVEGGDFEGGLTFTVLDKVSNQPVAGAILNAIFEGRAAAISTNEQGRASLQVSKGAIVRVKVSASGYYSDSRSFTAIRPQETILISSRSAQISFVSEGDVPSIPAPVEIQSSFSVLEGASQDKLSFSMPQSSLSIKDSQGNAVSSGTVSIVSASGQEIASAPIANGVAGIADLLVSSDFSIVVSTTSGVMRDGSVQVFDSATNNLVLTRAIAGGSATLSPTATGANASSPTLLLLSAKSIDGTPISATFTASVPGAVSCTGSFCSISVPAGGSVQVTASAPGFHSESVSSTIVQGQLLPLTIQLVPNTDQLRFAFSGAEDSQGRAVSSLLAGHDYFLKFSIYSTARDETVFSIRLGAGQSVSSEGFGLLEFDASAFDGATKSLSYSPQPTCVDYNNGNSPDGLYKWMQLIIENKGAPVHRIVSIPARVKTNSPASMPVFYRLSGASGAVISRNPVDAELGTSASSPSKDGCYAADNRLDLPIALSNSCADATALGQCSTNIPLSCQRAVDSSLQLLASAGCCPVGTVFSGGQCNSPQAQPAGSCADGTAEGHCSTVNTPKACVGGALVPASQCGCPAGQYYSGGLCRPATASCQIGSIIFPDGQCLLTAPGRCVNGIEAPDSAKCGCPAGATIVGNSCSGGSFVSSKCSDGTALGSCLQAKPLQCISVGGRPVLASNALYCGCAGGKFSDGVACRDAAPQIAITSVPSGCVCTQEFAPVCGSDGSTYGNSCIAACSSVQVAHSGACISGTPLISPIPAPASCPFPNSCLNSGNSDDYCTANGTVAQSCLACNRACGGNLLLSCSAATGSCSPRKCPSPAPSGTPVEQCVQDNSPRRCSLDVFGNTVLRDDSAQCGCAPGSKPDSNGAGCVPCSNSNCTEVQVVCHDAEGKGYGASQCLPERFSKLVSGVREINSEPILKCNSGGEVTADINACGCPSGFKRSLDSTKCVPDVAGNGSQVSLSQDITCAGCVAKDTVFLDSSDGKLKTASGKKTYQMQADDIYPADAFVLDINRPSLGTFQVSVQGIQSDGQTQGCYDYDQDAGKVVFRVRNSCPIEVRGNGFVHTGTGQPISSDNVTLVLRLQTIPPQDLLLELHVNLVSLNSLLVQPIELSGANTRQLIYLINNKQTLFGPRTLTISSSNPQSTSQLAAQPTTVASPSTISLASGAVASLSTQTNEIPGAGVKVLAWAGPGSLSISEKDASVATLSYDNSQPAYFVCQDQVGGGKIQGADSCAGNPNCCTMGWCNGEAFKGMFGAFKDYAKNTAAQSAFRRGVDAQGNPQPFTAISGATPFEVSTAAQVVDGAQRIVVEQGITLSNFESCGNFSNPAVYKVTASTKNGNDFKYSATVAQLQKFDYVDGSTCDNSKFVYDPSLARTDLRAQPLCGFLTGGCGCVDKSARSHVLSNNQNKDPFSLLAALPLLAALAPLLDRQGKMMQCQNDPNWNRDTKMKKQVQDRAINDARDDLIANDPNQKLDANKPEDQKKLEELAKQYGELPDRFESAFVALSNDQIKATPDPKGFAAAGGTTDKGEPKDFVGTFEKRKLVEKQPLRAKELDDAYGKARGKANELCAPSSSDNPSDRLKARIQLNGPGKFKDWIDEKVATGQFAEINNANPQVTEAAGLLAGIPFKLSAADLLWKNDGKILDAVDACEDGEHDETAQKSLKEFCWTDKSKVQDKVTKLYDGLSSSIASTETVCKGLCQASLALFVRTDLVPACQNACGEYSKKSKEQLKQRLGDPAMIGEYETQVENALKPQVLVSPTTPSASPGPSPSPTPPIASPVPAVATPTPLPPASNCVQAIVQELSSGNECEVYNKKLAGADKVNGLLVEQFGPILRRTAWFVDYAYGSFAGGDKADSKDGGHCAAVCQKKDRFEHLFGAGNKIFSVDRYGLDENCVPLPPLLKDKIPRDDPNKLQQFVQNYLGVALPTATPAPKPIATQNTGNNGIGGAGGVTIAVAGCRGCPRTAGMVQAMDIQMQALATQLGVRLGFPIEVRASPDVVVKVNGAVVSTNQDTITASSQVTAAVNRLKGAKLAPTQERLFAGVLLRTVSLEAAPAEQPLYFKGCPGCRAEEFRYLLGRYSPATQEAFYLKLKEIGKPDLASLLSLDPDPEKRIKPENADPAKTDFLNKEPAFTVGPITIEPTGPQAEYTLKLGGKTIDGGADDDLAKLISIIEPSKPVAPLPTKYDTLDGLPKKPDGIKEWASPFEFVDRLVGDKHYPGSGLLVTLGKPDPANPSGDYLHFTYDDMVKAPINAPKPVAGGNNEDKKVPRKQKLADLRRISKGEQLKPEEIPVSRDELKCVQPFVDAFKNAKDKKVKPEKEPEAPVTQQTRMATNPIPQQGINAPPKNQVLEDAANQVTPQQIRAFEQNAGSRLSQNVLSQSGNRINLGAGYPIPGDAPINRLSGLARAFAPDSANTPFINSFANGLRDESFQQSGQKGYIQIRPNGNLASIDFYQNNVLSHYVSRGMQFNGQGWVFTDEGARSIVAVQTLFGSGRNVAAR